MLSLTLFHIEMYYIFTVGDMFLITYLKTHLIYTTPPLHQYGVRIFIWFDSMVKYLPNETTNEISKTLGELILRTVI